MTGSEWLCAHIHRHPLAERPASDAVAGFFNMTNRVASATDMRPNSVYHGQAR